MAKSGYTADSYMCVAEKFTGFIYDKNGKSWNATNSKVEDKFIIKEVEKGTYTLSAGYKILITKLGDPSPVFKCKTDINISGKLMCSDNSRHFNMDTVSMNFLYSYVGGYWNNTKDTPYIEIGKCSLL